MKTVNVDSKNFNAEVLQSEKPVLVDFYATWCGPCRMVAPIIDELASERPDIKFCKIDTDQANDLASKYSIMFIPTLLVFNKGELITKINDHSQKASILRELDAALTAKN